MTRSAFTIPQVSVWKEVDATHTMEYISRLKMSPDYADIRVTPLLVVARAVLWAVQRTPMINARWSEGTEGDSIEVRPSVNLGIAAATPRGLLVPNIKNAHLLSLHDLARALANLTTIARSGRTSPADQHGGTITITNIGVFGVDGATPMINPGESGIIAVGAIRKRARVVDDEIMLRWVATIGGSFDHRVVDGDDMSRFVSNVALVLEDPAVLLT